MNHKWLLSPCMVCLYLGVQNGLDWSGLEEKWLGRRWQEPSCLSRGHWYHNALCIFTLCSWKWRSQMGKNLNSFTKQFFFLPSAWMNYLNIDQHIIKCTFWHNCFAIMFVKALVSFSIYCNCICRRQNSVGRWGKVLINVWIWNFSILITILLKSAVNIMGSVNM